jgi:tRNA threonylcarbamoyladenosine biosynthesis protein TsaE
MKTIISKSVYDIESTKNVAKEITKILNKTKNFSVFLDGGLGSGKTFLVREILKNLGEKEAIPSPTYTYVNEYSINEKNYAHFDFYRLNSPDSFFEKGFEEISSDKNISCFSEWIDKISSNAQKSFSGEKFCIRIEFGLGVGVRKIKFFSV